MKNHQINRSFFYVLLALVATVVLTQVTRAKKSKNYHRVFFKDVELVQELKKPAPKRVKVDLSNAQTSF